MSTNPHRIFVSDSEKILSEIGQNSSSVSSVVSIIGPTGSGKTRTAVDLARRWGAERSVLVSVDSVALYRDLNIGSAKPTAEERDGLTWLGLDLLSLSESATSSSFVDRVLPEILLHLNDKKKIIVVGGSHFYERALCLGRAPGEASNGEFQKSLESETNSALHKRLLKIDRRFGKKIHLADRYRITRYLDLTERQGFSFEDLQSSQDKRPWTHVLTLATSAPSDLEERTETLEKRVNAMLEAGWVTEVEGLLSGGASPSAPGLRSIGYRDVVDHLLGKIDRAVMRERIVLSHRQLAKVQRTWVRGLQNKSDSLKSDSFN